MPACQLVDEKLVRDVFQRAGVSIENLADGFLVDWADGFWIATNFTEKSQRPPIPRNARILIGSREVPTAGVPVWQE